jgi:hypothetical protein
MQIELVLLKQFDGEYYGSPRTTKKIRLEYRETIKKTVGSVSVSVPCI